MPEATQHVVDQGPGEAKQNQSPEPMRKTRLHEIEITVGMGSSRQPPDKKDGTKEQRHASDAMHDRHHHRQHGSINLQVR